MDTKAGAQRRFRRFVPAYFLLAAGLSENFHIEIIIGRRTCAAMEYAGGASYWAHQIVCGVGLGSGMTLLLFLFPHLFLICLEFFEAFA